MRCAWLLAMVACGGAAEEAKGPAATVVVAPAPRTSAPVGGGGGGPSASPDVVLCSPTRTTDALDREALSQALGEASAHLESCAFPQGPRGPGQVRIEVDPTGCVASAVVETPRFHQTNAAACIEDIFRHVVIPPFAPEGRPVRITHTFVLR